MVAITKKEKAPKQTLFVNNIELISDKILADFILNRNNKSLRELKGKISFVEDYNYKLMRF